MNGLRSYEHGWAMFAWQPNNSGKTSILEAVSVFCRPLDVRVMARGDLRRIGSLEGKHSPRLYASWHTRLWRRFLHQVHCLSEQA